ncbi:hypothetical protein JOY44_26380 (plasmid) [Phormidium sp. CLA17]|nr:hypothetical protein [Leptolyngbya sp. Cla-17]
MIPPASAQKWVMLTTAALLPLGLVGMDLEHKVQASQTRSFNNSALPNGVYLYSNTPQPDQLLNNYVLFQHQNGKVVGAFYSPRSEFSCFVGEIQGSRLDVEATMNGDSRPVEADTSLVGLHSISTFSANDQRILSMCQQSDTARGASMLAAPL